MDANKIKEITEQVMQQVNDLRQVSSTKEINRDVADAEVLGLRQEVTDLRSQLEAKDRELAPEQVRSIVMEAMAPMLRSLPVSESEDARAPGGIVDKEYLRRLIATPTSDPKVKRLQDAHDKMWLARRIWGSKQRNANEPETALPAMSHEYNEALRSLGMKEMQVRATTFSTTGAATGDEWTMDLPSAAIIEAMYVIGDIEMIFNQFTLPNGYESATLPGEGSDPTVYTVAQGTADDSTGVTVSNPGTRQVSYTVGKHGAYVLASAETTEDMIVASIDRIKKVMARAHRRGLEHAIISGDTGSNLDSTQASGDVDDIFNGLRENAVNLLSGATTSLNMNSLTAAENHVRLRILMGKYAVKPGDLALILPLIQYYKWLEDDSLLTMEKYGNQATILTGELARLGSIPIFVSGEFAENLNTSGVIDGATTDNHAYLLVNRRAWTVVRKRELEIKVDDKTRMHADQLRVIGFRRVGFVHEFTTSDPTVAYGYNLDN